MKKTNKLTKEFFEAVALMEQERGVPSDYICEKIAGAIVKAAKKDYNDADIVFADINAETKTFRVYIKKPIVDEVVNPDAEASVEEAKEYMENPQVGEYLEYDLDTMQFGRIAAQTAKHIIRQGIKEAERGQVIREFQSKSQDLVTAKVSRIDPISGNVTLEIGNGSAVLPKAEQVPGETFIEGEMIKVYVVEVKETEKGPRVMISRAKAGLVKRLFEQEVPEIFDGIVTINAISRDAGSRTKMAVSSKDDEIDPIGACIGQRGARVNKIVDVLGGEKIDIVKYSDDPAEFIKASLAPADVLEVEILEATSDDKKSKKSCVVTVPDNQLSLAIGNKGQNARLAAQLTGWNIDIKPESGFYEG